MLSISTIIYYPEPFVEANLAKILEAGHQLIVFDNTPSSIESKSLRGSLAKFSNFSCISCSSNVGISKALNQLMDFATCKRITSMVFLDQDTLITSQSLNYMNHAFESWKSIFFVEYAIVTFTDKSNTSLYALSNSKLNINSGSLININLVQKLGGYDEKLFVDLVDYEISLRALNSGYKIAKCFNCPGLDHQSRQPDLRYRFLGKTLLIRRYHLKRVLSALYAHLYLLKRYLFCNIFFSWLIIKSLMQYSFFQLVARVIPLSFWITTHKS